ncbi:MAG: sugar phosphate isomerase/epimerase [Flavobacteriales bacterium]|nr:sugar phosphate isomerase/epimerase [Flavobacteriales bacterium]
MSKIKVACETYTWQMPGEGYKGKLDHIMGVVNNSGFEGIEPETSFFHHLSDPIKMKEVLDKHHLKLTALCHVEDWLGTQETETEKANADKWIDFLAHFPDTIYLMVQMPGTDRNNLKERQANLLSCVNDIGQRASDKGITCSYHPNSPEGSIYRTEADYKILLNGLDSTVGYTPDVGHMAKTGMDPLSIIKQYRDQVNLVHYKDMFDDGSWAPTGEGIIDFDAITKYLIETNYDGWIVMEDECDECITNPDGVTLNDGNFIDANIRSLLS